MQVHKRLVPPSLIERIRADVLEGVSQIYAQPIWVAECWEIQRGAPLDLICSTPAVMELVASLERLFGMACDLQKSSARIQECDGERRLDWHQDYAPMQLAPDESGMIAWVPLDPIDGTRPSLEIGEECEAASHVRSIRQFLISDLNPAEIVVVTDLALGDIVSFSPFEPHRTYISDGMTNSRMSLDMRFQK